MMACAIISSPHTNAGPYGPPVADFLPDNLNPSQYDTVNFQDLSTKNPTSWNWTINGAQFAITQDTSYYFTTPGYYTIKLTATNAYGSSSKSTLFYVPRDNGGGGGFQP